MNFKEALIAHQYAHVLRWIADGEKVQTQGSNGTWFESTDKQLLQDIYEELHIDRFRLAPRTITANGVEVPAPESVAPGEDVLFYIPDIHGKEMCYGCIWHGSSDLFHTYLGRGLVYLNKEDAIARAKAMLMYK